MLVIPAVDIKGGKCVRLVQGKADEVTVFSDDPVAVARRWEGEGAQYLHVVDLDGAFEGAAVNIALVKSILTGLQVKAEVGGGLRTETAVREILDAGADRVVIGTAAVESVKWVKDLAGKYANRVAIGIDVKKGLVATHGWVQTAGVTPIELVKLLNDAPIAAYIYTDVLRDGTRTGPNIPAIRRFAAATQVPVIGSGGVSSLDDLRQLALLTIHGVIIGRALYDGAFTLAQATQAAQG